MRQFSIPTIAKMNIRAVYFLEKQNKISYDRIVDGNMAFVSKKTISVDRNLIFVDRNPSSSIRNLINDGRNKNDVPQYYL